MPEAQTNAPNPVHKPDGFTVAERKRTIGVIDNAHPNTMKPLRY